jgi:hypothetical protein
MFACFSSQHVPHFHKEIHLSVFLEALGLLSGFHSPVLNKDMIE